MFTLLKFHAPWCQPCKLLAPTVEAFAQAHPEGELRAVNVDESPTAAAEYGVMSLPTVLMLKDGQEVARHVGNATREAFFEKFEAALSTK